jgi:hypothetical protein
MLFVNANAAAIAAMAVDPREIFRPFSANCENARSIAELLVRDVLPARYNPRVASQLHQRFLYTEFGAAL